MPEAAKSKITAFRNASLAEFIRRNGWYTVEFRLSSSMTYGNGKSVRDKAEVLTANYPIKPPEKDRRK
jgi:hypothetical protein